MDKKLKTKDYLNKVRLNAYITMLICVGSIICTNVLMIYVPALFMLNPIAILVTGFYGYYMFKKFKFLQSIDRMLDYDSSEEQIKERIKELYFNLSKDIDVTVQKMYDSKRYYMGERMYTRADSNTFIEKNIDFKISKKVYEIYYEKQHQI